MSRKRKRPAEVVNQNRTVDDPSCKQKKRKVSSGKSNSSVGGSLQHSVLSCYYPHVMTLRAFILSKLPATSQARRRKIASYGSQSEKDSSMEKFLDETLVGVLDETGPIAEDFRQKDFLTFSQAAPKWSHDNGGSAASIGIGEVVDFAIWSLFRKTSTTISRPKHVLCQGYQKAIARTHPEQKIPDCTTIPGLVLEYPNNNVQALKKAPWTELMPLLGRAGNVIMRALLLDCGVFLRVDAGKDNYYQLSGVPISDLVIFKSGQTTPSGDLPQRAISVFNGLTDKIRRIVFVRHRILYARPSLNAEGDVAFGMRNVHVLSRYSDPTNQQHTFHVLKYIFPRQFGLHNVFTSLVDSKTTSQPFKDYANRDHEILSHLRNGGKMSTCVPQTRSTDKKIPKRLRSGAFELARKLQRNHKRCSYTQLLRHYCSQPCSTGFDTGTRSQCSSHQSRAITQDTTRSGECPTTTSSLCRAATVSTGPLMAYATPIAQVSAFCRAVIQQLLPRNSFGTGQAGVLNQGVVLEWIDHFVAMRRNEAFDLHSATQGLKITSIEWLNPPKLGQIARMSVSDHHKRWELLHEFVYYLFDSIIIPLIRSNFYVTESAVHRNRLFYFRHDLWRKISEPSLAQLKLTMFEKYSDLRNLTKFSNHALGHSTIRLLPKANGVRVIANLKKGMLKNYKGRLILGKSINKKLEPVFDALGHERVQHPSKLGSSMFSSSEIHKRLKGFSRTMSGGKKLYFVKLDIKSCFDSIPQTQLVALAEAIFSENQYRVHTHAELKPPAEGSTTSVGRRFVRTAFSDNNEAAFSKDVVENLASDKKRVVFAETGYLHTWRARPLLQKLREHVQHNVVKIGSQEYRQRNGIPQGSILSPLLCSFFYGAFEAEHLNFLDEQSLLLRMIDDFLLITTDKAQAQEFLEVMASGNPSYGISVQQHKSLTNFDAIVSGRKIPRLHGTTDFPYIGLKIDTKTLAVSKSREEKDPEVRNGLTVQTVRAPGAGFRNKVLHSLKIQLVAVVLDTKLNSKVRVMASLYQCFTETAMKMHQYLRALGAPTRPGHAMITRVIEECVRLAFNLMRQSSETRTKLGYECSISKSQTTWLAAASMLAVLGRKQSQYRDVIKGLLDMRQRSESVMKVDSATLRRIVEDGSRGFRSYIF